MICQFESQKNYENCLKTGETNIKNQNGDCQTFHKNYKQKTNIATDK
jgi:hypothetical protein